MKILGQITTYNDSDTLDGTLQGLLDQSRPLDKILIVDNHSTDDTLNRNFPEKVTVIRNSENLGTNGATIIGFEYAMSHSYDWVWVLDADSCAKPDALEKLLELYDQFPPETQNLVKRISSMPIIESGNFSEIHGVNFHDKGSNIVKPDPDSVYYECDASIWSGSLFRMEAVKKIGLPHPDYFLDYGDLEYGYKGKMAGFKGYIHKQSNILHDLHAIDDASVKRSSFMALFNRLINKKFNPTRFYYSTRNHIYFWLHEFHNKCISIFLKESLPLALHIIQSLVRSNQRWSMLKAISKGIWDGIFKNMHHRY